jgi:NADP-dependent 3-hydroxy acid dehydrogenase YdfG
MNNDVGSFFFMTRQVIPQTKKQNSRHVVNISAVLADQPSASAPALLAVLSKLTMPAVSKALAAAQEHVGDLDSNPYSTTKTKTCQFNQRNQ